MAWKRRAVLCFLIFVAFILRVYRLNGQDLSFDEAWSAYLAVEAPPTVLQRTGLDIHPPFYYYLLHATVALFGESAFAVRFPSLLAGVALVALMYPAGRRWGGRGIGVLAMGLTALSPLHIYYSQEARMYELVAFLGLMGFYALSRAVEGEGRWLRVGALVHALLLYSHYLSMPLVLSQNLYAALRWWRRRSGGRAWLVWQGLPWLLFLPWLSFAGDAIVRQARPGINWPPTGILQNTVVWLALGPTAGAPSETLGLLLSGLLVVGLAGGGLLLSLPLPGRGNSRSEEDPRLLLALYLGIPVAFLWAGTLKAPHFAAAYLLPLSVPYLLSLARGLWRGMMGGRVGRWGAMAGMAALTLLWAFSLHNLYYGEAYRKGERYREVIAYVQEHARSEDGLILTFPLQWSLFRYYYTAPLPPVYEIPTWDEWFRLRQDPTRDIQLLQEAGAQHRRLWLVHFYRLNLDNQGTLEAWLRAHYYPAADRWFDLTRVMLFVGRREEGPSHPVGVSLGEAARLLGFDLESAQVAPGGRLRLTLYWEPLGPTRRPHAVFTHVEDGQGGLWGQDDHPPGWSSFSTTQWGEGQPLADEYVVLLRGDMPPGEYDLLMGMYDPDAGQRLRIYDENGQDIGDALLLSKVRVR